MFLSKMCFLNSWTWMQILSRFRKIIWYNCLKRVIVVILPINPFVPNAPFLYPLKTSENCNVFWCFQGIEKGCVGNKWVNEGVIIPILEEKFLAPVYPNLTGESFRFTKKTIEQLITKTRKVRCRCSLWAFLFGQVMEVKKT